MYLGPELNPPPPPTPPGTGSNTTCPSCLYNKESSPRPSHAQHGMGLIANVHMIFGARPYSPTVNCPWKTDGRR